MLPIFSELVSGKYCSVVNHFHIYSVVFKVEVGHVSVATIVETKIHYAVVFMLIKIHSIKPKPLFTYIFRYLIQIQDWVNHPSQP